MRTPFLLRCPVTWAPLFYSNGGGANPYLLERERERENTTMLYHFTPVINEWSPMPSVKNHTVVDKQIFSLLTVL
jgi:hypothetical protein